MAGRLVHVSTLLGAGALKAGSPEAAAAVAQAVEPLLLFSVCNGQQEEQAQHDAQHAQQAQQAQQPLLELPPDIPPELLEGTVEGQQLRAQQAQQAQQGGHFVAGAASGAPAPAPQEAGEAPAPQLPLVVVEGSWRLAPEHMLSLLERVLLPLASRHTSHDLLPHISADVARRQFPHLLPPAGVGPAAGGVAQEAGPEGGGKQQPAFSHWQPPSLKELIEEQGPAAAASPGNAVSGQPAAGAQQPLEGAAAARVGVLAALLRAVLQPPTTVLTDAPLPFSNAALPWDTVLPAVLYIAAGPEGGPRGGAAGAARPGFGQPLRRLRTRLSSLVQHSSREDGSSGGGGAAGAGAGAGAGSPAGAGASPFGAVEDVEGVHSLLAAAIEVSFGVLFSLGVVLP